MTGIRKYSYDILIELGTLYLGVKFPCKVGTIWETYMKNIQASGKPDLINGKVVLSETLSNNFVLDFDMSKNTFAPRNSVIKILLYTEKGVREAGMLQFDLTAALNKRLNEMTIQLPLQKCPDKNAKLSFTLKTNLREEIKNNPGNFISGMMPDMIGGAKPQSPFPINAPTNDGFKKKISPGIPPPMPPSTFSTPQFQQNDNFKHQREALLSQNSNISRLLTKAQSDNEGLRRELRKALQQKQDLYAQIQSYTHQLNNLRGQNQQLRRVEEAYNETQEELITARTQLARIFNAASEIGGPALTDKLQSAVGIQQKQF